MYDYFDYSANYLSKRKEFWEFQCQKGNVAWYSVICTCSSPIISRYIQINWKSNWETMVCQTVIWWFNAPLCVQPLSVVLTFSINDVHCSSARCSREDAHSYHVWRHCQVSKEALKTLSDPITDCGVHHCGRATAYLKNSNPPSTLVVTGTLQKESIHASIHAIRREELP